MNGSMAVVDWWDDRRCPWWKRCLGSELCLGISWVVASRNWWCL